MKREFEEHGTKIRALNDRGDESPEGELTDGILDQLAKFERAKTAERTRRGKLRKAREGKVIAGSHANYGFGYDAARDGYEINEEAVRVVRRIFRMVGAEGATLHAVKRTFEREGLPTPKGGTFWSQPFLRSVVLDDVYKPYAFEEVGAAKAWLDKLSQADRKRSTFQDMAAEGLLTLEELREKLADLEDTRKVAERELKTVRDRAERVAQLELDKETLLTSFGGEWPAALDTLAPEERQRVYRCSGCGWTRRPTATSS